MVTQKNANSENKQCICRNTKIVTVDNEIICGGCGQVFGYEDYQERAPFSKVPLSKKQESGHESKYPYNQPKKLHTPYRKWKNIRYL